MGFYTKLLTLITSSIFDTPDMDVTAMTSAMHLKCMSKQQDFASSFALQYIQER